MDALTRDVNDSLMTALEEMCDRAVRYSQSTDPDDVEIAKTIIDEWTEPINGDCLLTHHLLDDFENCRQVVIFGSFEFDDDDDEMAFGYGDLTFLKGDG